MIQNVTVVCCPVFLKLQFDKAQHIYALIVFMMQRLENNILISHIRVIRFISFLVAHYNHCLGLQSTAECSNAANLSCQNLGTVMGRSGSNTSYYMT